MNNLRPDPFDLEDGRIATRRKNLDSIDPEAWHIRMFDLHDPKNVEEYQTTRLALFRSIARQEAYIIRENSVVLAQNGVQKVFACIEWADVKPEVTKISMLDKNGCPEHHKKRIKNV